MYVYPVAGRVVIDPASGKLLPEEGAEVPADQFWLRRLLDGDVTDTAPTPEPDGDARR